MALELRQFNIGARVETPDPIHFFPKNIGSFGNLRKQERIFELRARCKEPPTPCYNQADLSLS